MGRFRVMRLQDVTVFSVDFLPDFRRPDLKDEEAALISLAAASC